MCRCSCAFTCLHFLNTGTPPPECVEKGRVSLRGFLPHGPHLQQTAKRFEVRERPQNPDAGLKTSLWGAEMGFRCGNAVGQGGSLTCAK